MTPCDVRSADVVSSRLPLETAEAIRAELANGSVCLQSLLEHALQLLERHEAYLEGLRLPGAGKSVPVVDAGTACLLLEKSIPLRVRMLQLSNHKEDCVEDLLQISIALAAVRDHIRRSGG